LELKPATAAQVTTTATFSDAIYELGPPRSAFAVADDAVEIFPTPESCSWSTLPIAADAATAANGVAEVQPTPNATAGSAMGFIIHESVTGVAT